MTIGIPPKPNTGSFDSIQLCFTAVSKIKVINMTKLFCDLTLRNLQFKFIETDFMIKLFCDKYIFFCTRM